MTTSVTNCIEVPMPFELFWRKISQIGLKLQTMPLILKSLTKKVKNLSGRGVNNSIIMELFQGYIGGFGILELLKDGSCPWYGIWTRGATSRKIGLVVCATLPETLTLFQDKICDFPYPISDLIKNVIPYFRPHNQFPRSDQC